MPEFRVFRESEVPGREMLERIHRLLGFAPERAAAAIEFASALPTAMLTAADLGAVAARLETDLTAGMEAIRVVVTLATYLARPGATPGLLAADLALAGLAESDVDGIRELLEKIVPSATDIWRRQREAEAVQEVLPTITDFSAACDLRAVFSESFRPEHILGAETTVGASQVPDIVAWVPVSILTFETRDFAGRRTASTFQVPLAVLRNLVRVLQALERRLERSAEQPTVSNSARPKRKAK